MTDDRFARQSIGKQDRVRPFAFVIAAGMCVLFSVYSAVSDFCGFRQVPRIELDSRINPNDAPAASLVRLPGIGVKRAEAIVTYRKNFAGQNSDGPVFQDCSDLQKVKGIGLETARDICEWLKFE